MSSAAVWKAANSAPSRRNYAGEIEVLLQQSEEKCKAAAEIDMGIAIMKAESRLSSAADQALQRGADAAEVARAKIAEQQDRFKTGLQVDGIHLDATMVESGRAQQAQQPFLANKYSMQMSHHKTLQDHERMSRGKAVPRM
jgi:phage tail tube protein FII